MKKILLPVDGSSRSLKTVEAVKQFFHPDNCQIIVVNYPRISTGFK